jgi:hypothetical protein
MDSIYSFQPGPPRVGGSTLRLRAVGAFLACLVALSEYGLFAALDLISGQKPFVSFMSLLSNGALLGVPVAIVVGTVFGPAAARSDVSETYRFGA